MRRLGWLIACAAQLVCAGSVLAQGGPPPATVVLDAAKLEQVEQWRNVTGEVRVIRRSLLASEESGKVVSLGFDEGDRVTAGTLLAELDATRTEIEVRAARADLSAKQGLLDQRKAELSDARLDLERVTELRSRGSASENEFDDATTLVAVAEARLREAEGEHARAEADLAEMNDRLSDMRVTAPFDGIIVEKRAEVGQWVGVGDPVCELIELDRVEVRLDVPERYVLPLLADGARVRVRVEATGETIDAEVTTVVPDVDPLSRLAPVRVVLDNNETLRLAPGMSIRGQVPTGLSDLSTTVHKDAILRDDAGEFLFFAAGPPGQQVAAVARVRTLFAVGERVVVESRTLPPNAMCIIEGNERVFPGQPLMVMGGQGESQGDDQVAGSAG